MYHLLYFFLIPFAVFCSDPAREEGEWRDSRDYIEVAIEEKETEEPPQEIILVPIRLEGRLRRLEEDLTRLQSGIGVIHTRMDGHSETLDRHNNMLVNRAIDSVRAERGILEARRNAWRLCALNATISLIIGAVVYML